MCPLAMCSLDPFLSLIPSYPAQEPLSGVEGHVRLSRMAAVSSALRPEAIRSIARSQTPTRQNNLLPSSDGVAGRLPTTAEGHSAWRARQFRSGSRNAIH